VLEVALTLPVVLALSFGCVEFGYFFFVKNTVQGAAREGARAAITPTATNSDVTTAVSNAMTAAGLQSSGYTVSTSPTNVSGLASGTAITVTVQCTWGTVGVRPLGIIGTNKIVKGVTVMRKEGT
jgi:Flp pilus assembly protein TadG